MATCAAACAVWDTLPHQGIATPIIAGLPSSPVYGRDVQYGRDRSHDTDSLAYSAAAVRVWRRYGQRRAHGCPTPPPAVWAWRTIPRKKNHRFWPYAQEPLTHALADSHKHVPHSKKPGCEPGYYFVRSAATCKLTDSAPIEAISALGRLGLPSGLF